MVGKWKVTANNIGKTLQLTLAYIEDTERVVGLLKKRMKLLVDV
jgi:hypothetical protein